MGGKRAVVSMSTFGNAVWARSGPTFEDTGGRATGGHRCTDVRVSVYGGGRRRRHRHLCRLRCELRFVVGRRHRRRPRASVSLGHRLRKPPVVCKQPPGKCTSKDSEFRLFLASPTVASVTKPIVSSSGLLPDHLGEQGTCAHRLHAGSRRDGKGCSHVER